MPFPDVPALQPLLDIALDLSQSLPTAARYRRVLAAVRQVIPCDASALLRYHNGLLQPVVVDGLSPEVLSHRFRPEQHPRLAAILTSRTPVRFAADDPRPDPYDGLVSGVDQGKVRVHSCMGCALYVGDDLIGALTVDALAPGRFAEVDDRTFAMLAALTAAAVRTAGLIEALEQLADRRGQVARQLVSDALERGGGGIQGESAVIRRLRDELKIIADSDLTVLITGETGVGKELVARMVHAHSRRASQPLVYVNCGALPESIAESELFGHVRGAYTGAVGDRPGKFELADGGTLFLDEVGELPLLIQAKLLRALQHGEIQRVGADRNVRVDVRILAASNRVLAEEVSSGRFRADLFHRLSVYPVQVPPLRERREDIPLLASVFLRSARLKLGIGTGRLSADASARLVGYDWPGNVRELEHVIMRAALRASGGKRDDPLVIEARHLGLEPPARRSAAEQEGELAEADLGLAEAVDRFQRALIQKTTARFNGNWSAAARQLRIDRSNLHRLARRLGLK